MARLNSVAENKSITKNKAGGTAYKEDAKLEIASLILTTLLQDNVYEKGDRRIDRLKDLFNNQLEDKTFLAKTALYAREKAGLRTISHVCTECITHLSGLPWLSSYYEKIVNRVDDMSEIISYIYSQQDKSQSKHKLPSALKRGFAKAFDKFDDYQITKYQNWNKNVKLVDIVNLLHPRQTDKNKNALSKLMKNELKVTQTWQAKIVEATKEIKAETVEEKEELKKEAKKNVWREFVDKGYKIEYFALLKNLSNIAKTEDTQLINDAIKLLTDDGLIRKSKILPFRYLSAYYALSDNRQMIIGLNTALQKCLSNVPVFEGKTLIALDVSGSMSSPASYYPVSSKHKATMADLGALFAAVLGKSNNADIITYTTRAKYINFNPLDSITTLCKQLNCVSGGTNANSVFDLITKEGKYYDRIILLSDMQSWGQDYGCSWAWGCEGPQGKLTKYFNNYKRISPNCKLYSFDLTGLGTCLFPQDQVYCLAGISDKVFDILPKLEKDKNAFVNEIESINL